MTTQLPDTPSTAALHANAKASLASTANATSPFIKQLQHDLTRNIVHDIELTMRVAVMMAGGLTRKDIITSLNNEGVHADELDIKMAVRRLTQLATDWKTP